MQNPAKIIQWDTLLLKALNSRKETVKSQAVVLQGVDLTCVNQSNYVVLCSNLFSTHVLSNLLAFQSKWLFPTRNGNNHYYPTCYKYITSWNNILLVFISNLNHMHSPCTVKLVLGGLFTDCPSKFCQRLFCVLHLRRNWRCWRIRWAGVGWQLALSHRRCSCVVSWVPHVSWSIGKDP